MNSILNKIQKSFILFMTVFSLSLQAADAVTWSEVSLGREDSRGANALLALVRNIDRFSAWLEGDDLGENTQVMVRIPKNSAAPKITKSMEKLIDEATGKEIKTLVTTSRQVSSLRYIVSERSEKNPDSYKRILLVKEEMITLTKTRKEGTRDILVSSSLSYNYPALDVSDANLESDSSKAYKDAADSLFTAGAPECVDFAGESQLCRIQSAATKLIRAASRKAKELATVVAQAKSKDELLLDTSSPKSVTFEESPTGDVRNVVISGFVRAKNEKLLAPDAVSAWVIKISGNTQVSVEERKPKESDKVQVESLQFE